MTRIITIANQQETVAKTAAVANLGMALANLGKKVTLLELDPANQLAAYFDIASDTGIDSVLTGSTSLDSVIHRHSDKLNLVTAGNQLAAFEQSAGGAARAFKLKQVLQQAELEQQDFILIDGPNTTGLLAINCLMASDEVLMPVTSHYPSLQGMTKTLQFVQRIEKSLGQRLRLWLAITQLQLQDAIEQQIRQKIIDCFPQRVLNSVVQNIATGNSEEAFKQNIHSVNDYQALAQDLIVGRTG